MPASAAAAPCPGGRDGAGWTLSTTTFDNHYTRHAYVGNGYLSQRVPPAGTGYMATGEKTGWPLFTPRYDGAFVAGLYGRDPSIVDADGVARAIDAAIPTWSTLNVTVGSETYSSTTPGGRISNFRQELFLGWSRGVDYSVGSGGSLSLSTRRPDLTPTSNVACCRPATATSEDPGMSAEAAVDGSEATVWAPDAGATGSTTVDLGRRVRVKTIAVDWTDTRPTSSSIETSLDGSTWTPAPADASGKLKNPTTARYVRVTLTRPGEELTGVREIAVTG